MIKIPTELILTAIRDRQRLNLGKLVTLNTVPVVGMIIRAELIKDFFIEFEIEKLVYEVNLSRTRVHFKPVNLDDLSEDIIRLINRAGWREYRR